MMDLSGLACLKTSLHTAYLTRNNLERELRSIFKGENIAEAGVVHCGLS
jgi:hypothetical protein